uniref:Small nuclear ribonucleoprotein polypeptide C n=1 Tax=Catharus ustulatus TaxID=91951 RepID=A0A8C3V402_CATUS
MQTKCARLDGSLIGVFFYLKMMFFMFYCDYCDTYLTHDSPSVRKTHCSGRKHKENVKDYYQKWMEEQAQSLIDKTSKANLSVTLAASPFLPLLSPAALPCSLPGLMAVAPCNCS